MSTPKLNATAEDWAKLAASNEYLYGSDRITKEKKDAEAAAKAAEEQAKMNGRKMEAEKRAMAATAANKPGQRHVSPPVAKPVPKAIAPVVAKAQQTARNIAATRPAPATGGIRASNDPSNPEIAQKLAEVRTYMTGNEPPGSILSSLAGASKPTTTAPSMGTKPGTTDVRPPMPSGPIQTQTLAPGATAPAPGPNPMLQMKKGGRVKAKAKSKSSYSSGGKVSSASKRGDGCAQRGKTKGRMI